VKITIHDERGPRTFEIGAHLDLAGDPTREVGPAPEMEGDGLWRARFSHTASGYQLELYSDDDRTHYVANGSAMLLEIERPRHVEAGDLVRAGAITITIGYLVETLPPAPELEPRERQLLGLVAAEPFDDAPRRVLADYWLERDDPRGALIHAQCEGDTAAADALLAEHGAAWLEPLRLAGLDHAQFVRGFVPSLLLGKEPLATWPGLYRLSPVAYEVAMRRDSHVSHQYGLVTVPAIRRTAIHHGPVSLKYSMNGATDFIARERAILSLFRGPHLATLLDVAHGRDTVGLVFCDDVRLYRLLGAGVRFDEPAAIELGVQIADALVELHGLGIVHGDVGPDHVTIAGGMARLVDFAMARGKQPLPPLPPLPPTLLDDWYQLTWHRHHDFGSSARAMSGRWRCYSRTSSSAGIRCKRTTTTRCCSRSAARTSPCRRPRAGSAPCSQPCSSRIQRRDRRRRCFAKRSRGSRPRPAIRPDRSSSCVSTRRGARR